MRERPPSRQALASQGAPGDDLSAALRPGPAKRYALEIGKANNAVLRGLEEGDMVSQ